MQPISTMLFFVGYLLAMPVAFRMSNVVAQQHRLAFTGHQTGVMIATIGWLSRGAWLMAAFHGLWMVGARIWFSTQPGRSSG